MQYYCLIGAIIAGYLIGSIPTAYIFGRVLKGIDIRKFGSGNVGATNALRVLGKGPGICVLLLDIIKGFIPVFFLGHTELLRIIFGVSCIIGHNWTVFLNFKGGKGVATTLGVLLGLAFSIKGIGIALTITVLAWLIVFLSTRIISVASIISSLAFPLAVILLKQTPTIIYASLILAFFIILRHKANIKRLLQGKEPKTTFRKPLS